jgi:cytochrome P450
MALRLFPRFLRPLVAPLLPSYRGLRSNVAAARRIVGGIVRARRAAEAHEGVQYETPADLLQWMMDAANAEERTPENLAQRLLILSLASIHTTALTMTQALYDLCAHPESLEPLREELVEVLRADGGWEKAMLNVIVCKA